MKHKRTYFFKIFGKTYNGKIGLSTPVWDEEGEKHIIVLKQLQHQSTLMKILWYTIDGSKWTAMEWGKRTEAGIERNDFYYHL